MRRHHAFAAAALFTLLPATEAFAQDPPPPQPYYPPGYDPNAQQQPAPYYQPGYDPNPYGRRQRPPRPPSRAADPGLAAGGGVLVGLGALGMVAGAFTMLAGALANTSCSFTNGCSTQGDQNVVMAGGLTILGGVLFIGGGVPMLVIGLKRVPLDPQPGFPPDPNAPPPNYPPPSGAVRMKTPQAAAWIAPAPGGISVRW